MSIDDTYNQPTEPQMDIGGVRDDLPAQAAPTTPLQAAVAPEVAPQQPAPNSRRKFMGKSLAGMAALGGAGVAAAFGGVALARWIEHGGFTSPAQGPMASSTQIGHLLRRAGFGATPDELAMSRQLCFNCAVDHLPKYHKVADDAFVNRIKALDLNFTLPAAQLRH